MSEIPPRVEKIFEIPVKYPDNSDVLIPSQELQSGVFLGNSISKVIDSSIKVCIMNTNNFRVKLDHIDLNLHNLDDFHLIDPKHSEHSLEIENRFSNLNSLIDTKDLNEEEKGSIIQICRDFHDIFHLPGDKLSTTTAGSHDIPIKSDSKIVNQKPYRLPYSAKNEIENQVSKMLNDGTIEPSYSPWNSPLLVVPKKSSTSEKAWRVVVDFRRVNDITIGDSYPLPNIVDILDQLGKSNYFSTLDLADGYHQVPLNPDDKIKTAFSTLSGHYHFNKMPFGLKGAPATFQRIMNNVLSGLTGLKCFVYMDDVVVYGYDLAEHNERLINIFQRFRKFKLMLNPQKCHFLRKEIAYLGHLITKDGIKPDESKISAIKHFPRPNSVTEIKSFLGLCGYYRRFINNFSGVAEPLINLTRKSVEFKWDAFCQESFESLKSLLCKAPILIYPNFENPFFITTDASNFALGAVLSQEVDSNDLPIAYASRVLNKAERNYSTTEKELLAIIWAVKRFRPYIFGLKFIIRTDHRPLVWLNKSSNPSTRIMRWRWLMDEHEYDIEYKSGRSNKNADALSRIQVCEEDIRVITRSKSKKNSQPIQFPSSPNSISIHSSNTNPNIPSTSSNSISNIPASSNQNNLSNPSDPIPILPPTNQNNPKLRSVTNEQDINKLLHDFHYSPIGGHQGVQRTYKRIKEYYYFPNMMSRIAKYIKNCKECQLNKYGKNPKCKMVITSTSKTPFEKVFMDIVGPLPSTIANNKYILTIQDDLTKFSTAVPLPNQESDTIAQGFVENFVCHFGVPDSILTDQGSNFMGEVFTKMCKILNVRKMNSTAYHPQTNGALERSHRTLGEYLRNFTPSTNYEWDSWIKFAMFTYNSTPHSSTGFMPFELVYGFKPTLPSSLKKLPDPVYNFNDYCCDMKNKLQTSWNIARNNLIEKKEQSKKYYDRNASSNCFQIGDQVLLKNTSKSRNKLEPLWFGPYEIIDIHPPCNSTIRIKRKNKRVHNNLLKLFNVE